MDISLGALVEVKYKCTVCNQETEESIIVIKKVPQ